MKSSRVGSPAGYYVHWLDSALYGEFRKVYRCDYNYRYHNYRYARYRKRTVIDEFLVVRTSKRCYRVIYFNSDYNYFQYFSAKNYSECAEKMKAIYYIFKRLEAAEEKRGHKKVRKNLEKMQA